MDTRHPIISRTTVTGLAAEIGILRADESCHVYLAITGDIVATYPNAIYAVSPLAEYARSHRMEQATMESLMSQGVAYIIGDTHAEYHYAIIGDDADVDAIRQAYVYHRQVLEAASAALPGLLTGCGDGSTPYDLELDRRIASAVPAATTVLSDGDTIIRFSEAGYEILHDGGDKSYLHVCDESALAVTDACRDQMLRYYYTHDRNLPGLGSTPQTLYFRGLTIDQCEAIGNSGQRAYYA